MRVSKKAAEESNRPPIGNSTINYGKRGVTTREEQEYPAVWLQHGRSIPHKFVGVWYVFHEVAGRYGIERFGPKRKA